MTPVKTINIVYIVAFFFCCYFLLYFQSSPISKLVYSVAPKKVFNETCNCSVLSTVVSDKLSFSKWSWFRSDNVSQQESLCNSDATALGPHQKVISFSLFLSPKYSALPSDSIHFNGIFIKAKELKTFYPNWQMRIYTYSHRDFNPQLCELTCAYPEDIFICYVENLPRIGNISEIVDARIWRFLPLVDPTVDIFISRDLDSSFSDRELAAVNEWIESNRTFHIMRDHPFHSVPILGGMWGAKSDQLNSSMKNNYEEAMILNGTSNGNFALKMYDQNFLGTHFYPTVKNDVIAHDSYFCERFNGTFSAQPFPVERITSTDFVANYIFDPSRYPISRECPIACRPLYGKDWKFC